MTEDLGFDPQQKEMEIISPKTIRLALGSSPISPYVKMLINCATNWKVSGSIPGGVIGIFHWHNPPGRAMDGGRLSL